MSLGSVRFTDISQHNDTQSKTVIRYCPDKTVVTIIDRTRKIKTVGQMRTQREEKEAPNKPFSIRVSVIPARFANRIIEPDFPAKSIIRHESVCRKSGHR